MPTSTVDPAKEATLRVVRAVPDLVGRDATGEPFGTGLGLERVVTATRVHLTGSDQVREPGFRPAVSIIADEGLTPDSLNAVMATEDPAATRVDAAQAEAARELGGTAMVFLGRFDSGGASMWELWKVNDGVAGELCAWPAVAWGRLTSTGKVQPIQ